MLVFEACASNPTAASILSGNYGFLYSSVGRLLFMLFLGILMFALSNPFGYAMGVITIITAVANATVMACYHERTSRLARDHANTAAKRFAQHSS